MLHTKAMGTNFLPVETLTLKPDFNVVYFGTEGSYTEQSRSLSNTGFPVEILYSATSFTIFILSSNNSTI